MSIANRIGLLIVLAALAMLTASAVVFNLVILPSYVALDEEDARAQLQSARTDLDGGMAQLERFASDWAAWDEAYRFVRDRNEAFIASNLETRVMFEQGLSLMWFVDTDGRTIWGRALDPNAQSPKPHPSFPGQSISPDSPLLGARDPESRISGIMETALGTMLVVSHPIVTSHFQGPIRGYFIAGRLLDERHWLATSQRLGLRLSGHPAALMQRDTDESLMLASLAPGAIRTIPLPGERQLLATTALYDLHGRQVILLKSIYERRHFHLGRETLRSALLSLSGGMLALLALGYWALRHYVTSPLKHLAEDIKRAKERELDIEKLSGAGLGEVNVVSREVRGMLERIAYLSHTDTLTGLPNRASFLEKATHALSLAKRYERRLVVLLLDLDGFKEVNETLGHEAGDRLLVAVAGKLKAILRESDSLARFGGDEFLILAENVPSQTGGAELARRVLDIFKNPLNDEDIRHERGCSIGIAVYPDDSKSVEDLLRMADIAMYRAKSAGGNTWRCHVESLECRQDRDT